MAYIFSEKYLQIIWNERLLTVRPKCLDGRSIRVLSPGLWNRCPGPDFSNASIIIGQTLYKGDIEIHRRTSDWFTHHHDSDSRYKNVILHVVWENDQLIDEAGRLPNGLVTLEIKSHLQRGWQKILERVECTYYPLARQIPPGACMMRWAMTDNNALQEILASAGEARLARRGAALLRQCAENGDVGQTLYETVFECLGYSHNRIQFQTLAHEVPLARIRECASIDEYSIGALLLGRSGMLPDPTTCRIIPEIRQWLQETWRIWWQLGHTTLPIVWDNSGGRPLNSVLRRLAAGIYWLMQTNAAPDIWLRSCLPENSAMTATELLRRLTRPLPENPIWRKCLSFDRYTGQEAALLGHQRLTDIALNVYLPYLYADAELKQDEALLAIVRNAYFALPRLPQNQTLKNACLRFLSPPSRERELLSKAAHQQGIMDIFKKFCLALNHDCRACPFIST